MGTAWCAEGWPDCHHRRGSHHKKPTSNLGWSRQGWLKVCRPCRGREGSRRIRRWGSSPDQRQRSSCDNSRVWLNHAAGMWKKRALVGGVNQAVIGIDLKQRNIWHA